MMPRYLRTEIDYHGLNGLKDQEPVETNLVKGYGAFKRK